MACISAFVRSLYFAGKIPLITPHNSVFIMVWIIYCFVWYLQALEALNKKDMTEIKSYGRPPALVEKVMEAVMILRGNEPTWAEAKRQLGNNSYFRIVTRTNI